MSKSAPNSTYSRPSIALGHKAHVAKVKADQANGLEFANVRHGKKPNPFAIVEKPKAPRKRAAPKSKTASELIPDQALPEPTAKLQPSRKRAKAILVDEMSA